MDTRYYKVGGLVFKVTLEEPWNFMHYSTPVRERIRCASLGMPIQIVPTRAGDKIPPRTLIQSRDELSADIDRHSLDFSQYEPFLTEAVPEPEFCLEIRKTIPEDLKETLEAFHKGDTTELQPVMQNKEVVPWFNLYIKGREKIFEFYDEAHGTECVTILSEDHRAGQMYPSDRLKTSVARSYADTSLMVQFAARIPLHQGLLVHSSAVIKDGYTALFLGKSGTGKSTHSRLWLEHIDGCELLNDDNPIIRLTEGKAIVYGSPWSGKTPCYRNLHSPLIGVVRLEQAPANEISSIRGLDAYASILAATNAIRYDKTVMDAVAKTSEQLATTARFYLLKCLPEASAAHLCADTLYDKRP